MPHPEWSGQGKIWPISEDGHNLRGTIDADGSSTILSGAASGLIAAPLIGTVSAALGATSIKKIATEEAFATPELVKAWLEIARYQPESSLDVSTAIRSIFDNPRPGSNQD